VTPTRSLPTVVRRRPSGRPAAVLLSVALSALLLTGCLSPNAQSFLDRTNGLRASRGVPTLAGHAALDAKAQAWAEVLAARGSLVHSTLSDGMGKVAWRSIGENLASGTESGDWPARLHDALVASPSHHANLVDRRYTHMGVGVASGRGQVYVVEVFAEIR
jgi:uncharacterized protein YkwD